MKRLFLLFAVLVFSLGLFAAPSVSSVGMSNTDGGGSNTNQIKKGETIYLSGVATNVTSTYALSNVYNGDTADTIVGELYIDYWDGVPGNGGSMEYGPSIAVSNFAGSGVDGTTFSCDFVVPTSNIPSGTDYITVYFGLEENKRSNYNYGTAIESEVDVSTAPSGYYTYLTYIDDTTTEAPTLTTPEANSVINDSFNIEFSLPETASDGSVKLSFTRTGGEADSDSHVLIVASEASGTHQFTLDATDLESSSYVTLETGSDNTLVSGAKYSVKIEYQDLAENAAASDTNSDVTYSNDYIELTGGDYNAGASFVPESTNNPYFWAKLTKIGSGASFTVTGIKFDGTGSMDNSDVTSISLWTSSSDTFDSGTASEIKTESTTYDPLDFTGLNITVGTSGIYVYLTVDVSATAESTDNIGAAILNNSDVTTTAIVTGAPINGGDHPLPVTLSSFTAEFVNEIVTLNWVTASESNNSHWNIYRSPSANFGQSVKLNYNNIPAAGYSSEPVYYNYTDDAELVQGINYWYWLECVAFNGLTELKGPIDILVASEEQEEQSPEIPTEFGLFQNNPNPFNPATQISFALEEDSNVELTIYNVKGQMIADIFNGRVVGEKIYKVWWDGKDGNGNNVSSGVYLYKLETDDNQYFKRMLLTK
jgi:hypothetical protein